VRLVIDQELIRAWKRIELDGFDRRFDSPFVPFAERIHSRLASTQRKGKQHAPARARARNVALCRKDQRSRGLLSGSSALGHVNFMRAGTPLRAKEGPEREGGEVKRQRA